MQKRNKLFLAMSLMLCALSFSLVAEESKSKTIPMPKRNEVAIISRAVVSTEIDIDSRKEGFGIKEGSKDDKRAIDYYLNIQGSGLTSSQYSGDDLGVPVISIAKVDSKTHTVTVKAFKCYMFGKYLFYLPVYATVTVPEGEQFIYIGTFDYKLDYALRITGVKRYDEYENAVKWAKERFGKDNIEVVRGELSEIVE